MALYWLLNRLLTYWFMSDVFPTLGDTNGWFGECHGDYVALRCAVNKTHPLSPNMITYV